MKNIEFLGAKENAFTLGANGMEPIYSVHLHKGTKIFAYGFGCSLQHFVIYNDNMDAVEICHEEQDPNAIDEYDLGAYFSPIHHVDDSCRPHSKKFGIGFYYDESGELISDEIIERSLERAKNLEELRKEVEERKKQEDSDTEKRLLKEYSYLQRCDRYDHKTVGANIRAELKKNFPTTKFSVRYRSFSGGDEYNISWVDGPKKEDVDAIVNKYQDMHPDAYSGGDYWDCKPSIFNDLYGSVGYIMTRRDISKEAVEKIKKRYADLTEGNMKSYQYGVEDALRYANSYAHSLDDMIHWLARNTDWQEIKPSINVQPIENCGNVEIVDYSEKAFAIIGDTKAVKDGLKELGGKFNPRLSCGAGWIFPKSKLDEVKNFLGI